MSKHESIEVYEHDKLTVSDPKFSSNHLNQLIKLNANYDFSYFDIIPNGVKFKQYVGIIQINNLIIKINPKANRLDGNEKWDGLLIQMLKRCKKLKASSSGYADVKTTRLNLLEIYFEIFLEELRKLIRLGLIKRYRFEKSNTKALKGKLDFPGNIRKNLIHRERFYTHHQTYDQKHLLHHVLYVALKIIENFTKGTQLFDCCKRLLLMFPDFNTSRLQKEDLDKVIFNRKTTNYRDAYQIARLIILNYSPDINMGNDKMISILFDMNKLWEEFILNEIKTSSYFSDYTVLGQDTKDFFTSNYLQPDIVIENKKTSKKFIFDTKWKCPPSNVATVEDLRQMYTYGRFWKAERTILLYPGHRKTSFESFQTDDSLPDTDELIQHKCKLGYINVFNENKDLSKDIGKSIYHLLED